MKMHKIYIYSIVSHPDPQRKAGVTLYCTHYQCLSTGSRMILSGGSTEFSFCLQLEVAEHAVCAQWLCMNLNLGISQQAPSRALVPRPIMEVLTMMPPFCWTSNLWQFLHSVHSHPHLCCSDLFVSCLGQTYLPQQCSAMLLASAAALNNLQPKQIEILFVLIDWEIFLNCNNQSGCAGVHLTFISRRPSSLAQNQFTIFTSLLSCHLSSHGPL